MNVKVNSAELERMKLLRIRHELQDYRYYCLKKRWLDEKIELCGIKLNGHIPAVGGSQPGTPVEGNWIIAAMGEETELIQLREDITSHITLVNSWLELVERSLGAEVTLVLARYAITEGYENADKCAEDLGLSNTRMLYRIINKAECCILENVKKLKNF